MRTIVTAARLPGSLLATRFRSALLSDTGSPLNVRMTSPRSMPARCAGLSASTALTIAPRTSFRPRLFASSELTPCTVTPIFALRTVPVLISCCITFPAMSAGTANPMPMLPPDGERI